MEIKEILKQHNREDLQIICKIESDLGITNLKEILEVSDGVMVARGDLGTEVSYTKLPIIQKRMIKTCREMGKLCIVATEMLETMMENSRPKRAETSDIERLSPFRFKSAGIEILNNRTNRFAVSILLKYLNHYWRSRRINRKLLRFLVQQIAERNATAVVFPFQSILFLSAMDFL